jgi:hypothetical protein
MRRVLSIPLLLLTVSCRPDFGERDSLITRTRIVAVRGEPADVAPGASATYSLLVASPAGVVSPSASWAFCVTPKLLTENGVASAACLGAAGVVPIAGGAASVTAAIPGNACGVFGPELGSADLRPRDPDVTGGFYQPVRVTAFGRDTTDTAYGLERLECKLTNASADVVTDYAARHKPNLNPELQPLTAAVRGAAVTLGAIPPGAPVTLRASWPAAAVETYVMLDPGSGTLVDRRESMRVSWYATAGSFESDRTGRDESEPETFTENVWTAPSERTTTHLFVVLRDSRGGVAFETYDLDTR